jgi:Phosphorylase superfamily
LYYDILLVVPLEDEWHEILEIFPQKGNITENGRVRYELESCNGVTIVAALQDDMGYWSAGSTTKDALASHHFGLVVSIGIGGGLSKDIHIGDVCYSGTVIDTVNNAKIRDSGGAGQDIELASDFFLTPKELYGPLAFMRVMPELRHFYKQWQNEQRAFAESLRAPCDLWDSRRTPRAYDGDIVCGQVTEFWQSTRSPVRYFAQRKNVRHRH